MELATFVKLSKETHQNLSQFINCADESDLETMAHWMASDHRTLVQKKMRLCMLFIERLAKDFEMNRYDLRNEHACKIAKKIYDATDRYDRMMPLV